MLCASPAFAMPVAEAALGMAIDLARGIGAADRAMRAGHETYGLESNAGAFLLTGSPVGIVGFGDLGRALRRLLAPFGCRVRVHDPWLPDLAIRREGAEPAALDDLLARRGSCSCSPPRRATTRSFLGERELRLIPDGGALLLMSRAGVVDFDALVRVVAEGRLRAAIDVFPEEPLPAGPSGPRGSTGCCSRPHRAGGMPEAFLEIGRLAVGRPRARPARAAAACSASAPRPRRSGACAPARSPAPELTFRRRRPLQPRCASTTTPAPATATRSASCSACSAARTSA